MSSFKGWLREVFALRFFYSSGTFDFHIGWAWIALILWLVFA